MQEQYWVIESEEIDNESKNIINEYFMHLMMSGMSPITVDKYWKILKKLLTTCPAPLKELTTDDIYLLLSDYKRKPSMFNLILTVLSGFSRFCMEEGYIDKPLVKDGWRLKRHKSIPVYLDDNE